jgi:hypothetical protein
MTWEEKRGLVERLSITEEIGSCNPEKLATSEEGCFFVSQLTTVDKIFALSSASAQAIIYPGETLEACRCFSNACTF